MQTVCRYAKLLIFNTFDYKYRQNLVLKITNSDKSQTPQFRETAVSRCLFLNFASSYFSFYFHFFTEKCFNCYFCSNNCHFSFSEKCSSMNSFGSSNKYLPHQLFTALPLKTKPPIPQVESTNSHLSSIFTAFQAWFGLLIFPPLYP